MSHSIVMQPRRPAEVGGGRLVEVHVIGNIRGTAVVENKKYVLVMHSFLYVPTMI